MSDLPEEQRTRQSQPAPYMPAFICPFCRVYTTHTWNKWTPQGRLSSTFAILASTCLHCGQHTIWRMATTETREGDATTVSADTTELIYPARQRSGPEPIPEMPPAVRADYDEARDVVDRSPRAAAALLRLALQKLMASLGQPGRGIDDDIRSLVQNGLDVRVQEALDVVRVTGNNAVHPGEINFEDDAEAVETMFAMLNYIVDQLITQPRKRAARFESLPEGAREAIRRRDSDAA